MKQFPRPMLEELHARRDALCAAEFPEGPRPAKHLPTLDEVVARINEDANDPSINGRCQEADKGKPLPDPTSRVDLAVPYADFFKQMSALEARSLRDLRAEAGGPVLHPEVAALRKEMGAYRYRAPGTGISAAEAGTVRAVPQEQWDEMIRLLKRCQIGFEEDAAVIRFYECKHSSADHPSRAAVAEAMVRAIKEMLK